MSARGGPEYRPMSDTTDTDSAQTPYAGLTPDLLLDAVETSGVRVNGSLLALNSYENRVYQVGIEDAPPLVAKFYRPGRWSDEAIREEHAFTLELAAQEIPVVPPLVRDGETLFEHAGFRFALFPRRGGRAPELDDLANLEWLGRFIGRIHAVGAVRPFEYRPSLTVARFGEEPVAFLLEHGFLPPEHRGQYEDLAAATLERVRAGFAETGTGNTLRLHGDCHPGNVLWTDDGPHFVDFDDCLQGPAVQDLWMLLSGDRPQMTLQLDTVLEGYREFADFDLRQLRLVEPLRALRLLHYSGWLARRWNDPAFPLAFPWFNSVRYWEEQILTLREQLNRLDAPPLSLGGA